MARAIFHANTPIISGTGHEIDNTIADYAADLRAPTPSAACELAVPDVIALLSTLKQYENSMKQHVGKRILQENQRFQMIAARLEHVSPKVKLENQKIYLDSLQDKLSMAVNSRLQKKMHAFEILLTRLNGLSPTAKLVNGYGYIEKEDGKALKSVTDIKEKDRFKVIISDGTIEGIVTNIENKAE